MKPEIIFIFVSDENVRVPVYAAPSNEEALNAFEYLKAIEKEDEAKDD